MLIASGILAVPFFLVGGIISFSKKNSRKNVLKWTGLLYLACLLIFLFAVTPYLMARLLVESGSRPRESRDSKTPADWELPYEKIRFQSSDGLQLSGWFVSPRSMNTVIIFSHGLFRSRYEVLERAMELCAIGYGAVVYDARHHGQSDSGAVSMGFFERNDVLGAIRWLRTREETSSSKIVLMGVSMGAAAVLTAAADTDDYSAIIADSPFLNLEKTIAHHAWLFLRMPKFPFVPIFLRFYSQRAHFNSSDFDVLAAAPKIQNVPILMLHGGKDRRIPVTDGKLIFEALPTHRKEFFVIENATHGAGYRFAPQKYLSAVTTFLSTYVE